MLIKFDFNNMMTDFIGEQGISVQDIEQVKEVAAAAFDYFEDKRGTGMTGWAELPYNQEEIVNDIIATAADVRANFDNFVVLGIGGSALGPMAAFNALCHFRYNDLPKEKRGVKFFVEDNVDPERMIALL
ncbi:MAG: glucose-6-phosphate isomerase, partial [Clostridia bacterium]|nr:glucose-6-phosphate isomerase [Clostridia bacterium]